MNDTQHWQAVCERDAAYDGKFWYAVATTGVYCKPSCASRLAKRENVRFFSTIEAARRDGLRACKRCKPDEDASPSLSKLLDICRHIESNPTGAHSLGTLAKRAGLSQFQLLRLFKSMLQLT